MENVSFFWLYALTMLPSFGKLLAVVGFVSALAVTVMGVWKGVNAIDGGVVHIRKPMYFFAPLMVVGLLGATAIPSHKQLAFIVGGYWAVNNEHVRQLPDNVAATVNSYLQELNKNLEGVTE